MRELRNFYANPAQQLRGDLIRRNDEADIIEATQEGTCRRSVDAVFLLDESGSVSSLDFARSKNFVSAVIAAFPDDNINQQDGSRFGLSIFDDSYRPAFYLSSYSTKSQYRSAVTRVVQLDGGTYLGSALTRILTDQFNEIRGLRPDSSGLPRILVVITDGQSSDSVALPARRLHDRNIVVYAIGIGNYNPTQLNQVASSSSHVYGLSSFSDLGDFTATLTASTCNEPQPLSLQTRITGNVEKDSFQYYKFSVPNNGSNLRVDLSDTSGRTLMYASRDNPHPYKYDNTFGFNSSSSSRKSIVISPQLSAPSTSFTPQSSDLRFAYVAITADTATATYTIEGSTCSATVCQEGASRAYFLKVPSMVISLAIIGILSLIV